MNKTQSTIRESIVNLEKSYGVDDLDVAIWLNTTRETVNRWKNQRRCPKNPKDVIIQLILLDECYKQLFEMDKLQSKINLHKQVYDTLYSRHEKTTKSPCWTFTKDERSILRLLSKSFNYIARDSLGYLRIYRDKPVKDMKEGWWKPVNYGDWNFLNVFDVKFEHIKWTDEEPCEFRRYV